MRWSVVIALWLTGGFALAQENALQADFRGEGKRLRDACGTLGFKAAGGCAEELFTDHPLHIAAGSIAPQNGFGLGPAFVAHLTPNESWRLSWDADAVASTNASWRAGGYMKIIHTPVQTIHVGVPSTAKPGESPEAAKPAKKAQINLVHPYTVFNLYAQATSLNKVYYFGEGNDSTLAGQSVFGMTQTIVGGNAIKPVYEWAALSKLNLALLGEMNGRFVNLRGENGQSIPSIQTIYNEASAPGLASQPGFMQSGEGLRIKPALFQDHLQLNYLATFQQFFAPANSHYSFLRWTVDLGHTVALYSHSPSYGPKDTNGPDECAAAVGAIKCPPISYSRNLSGSVGLRLLLSESIHSATSAVPFYFQQTLGGSDVNGSPALASYQDYRFRASNLLLLRGSFEHSIWGPFGFTFMADEGRVAQARADVGFDRLKHSFATGFTLRAGGFPMIFVTFAWGGSEGSHTVFNMNTALLGGSARPLLD
ncbi:MAG TPA: hypothetical protein VKR60_08010 [Candidatus Sulfotelmatobacter sp.]|nr:hypothetical protein [Candidatus Sulfotelmatobacter sp.]